MSVYKNIHYGAIILATAIGVVGSVWVKVKILGMGNFLTLVFSTFFLWMVLFYNTKGNVCMKK